MNQLCDSSHGLPHSVFWSHSKTICQFMERLSQQRNNFQALQKAVVIGKEIKQPLDISIFGAHGKVFHNKLFIRHSDVMKLVDRAIKKIKTRNGPKKNWNIQEIVILIWVVNQFQYFFEIQFYNLNLDNWELIASYVPGKNRNQCLFKMLKFQKKNLSQHPWTKQQQLLLKELVGTSHKKDWNKISEGLYFNSKTPNIYRLPKQCREHWSSYMVHQFKKGPWDIKQDVVLLQAVIRIGKRWIEIAKQLQGRTQNAIKNRCNLLLSKCLSTSEETDFNKNVQLLIQRIKQQSSTKKLNKLSRQKKSSSNNLTNQEQSFFLKQQQVKLQSQGIVQSQIKFINHVQQIKPSKVSDIQANTNIEFNDSRSDLYFQPEDIGRFLFMEQFNLESISPFSISISRSLDQLS